MSEVIGWIALGLAGLIGAINFYLTFLDLTVRRMFGWEYRWVSGIVGIGTILLVVALACLWRTPAAWYAAGVIALIDTAGLPWFAAIMALGTIKKPDRPPASEQDR